MTGGPGSPRWPEGLAFHLQPPAGNVFGNLQRAAQSRPDHPAIHYYGRSITYGALLAEAEALAGHLHHVCGVRRGDRVLVQMQNSPQFIAAFQAILRADAVAVPVNPMFLEGELDHVIADSGARVALLGDELLDRYRGFAPGRLTHVIVARYADAIPPGCTDPLPEVMHRAPLPLPDGHTAWATASAEPRPCPPIATGSDDLAVMPYTSGSTGRPKACMHPHSNVMFTAVAQAVWYRLRHDSVLTAFMPMFHVAGMQASMAAGLYAGASLVVMTRWDRDLIPALFARHGVTFWSAAPTMIADVMASPDFREDCFARLSVVTGGGSPMPEALAARLQARFGLRFCEGYGLTETIAPTHINPLDHPKRQCLGIPIFDTAAMIVDPDTLAPLPQGQTGELLVSGPQIMRGYWNDPQATAAVLVDISGRRWLRTGDLAHEDAEGYHHMVDRLKRMINVSGYKVSPAEVEALLYRHPAVGECCVIATSDAHSGEAVRALIVRAPGHDTATAEEIIAFARQTMAAYKVPRGVAFVDSLPRTGSNKIDWRSLQTAALAAAGGGG